MLSLLSISERPVQDYAKSSIYVAQHNMKIPNGDLELAREYLQRVASSNAEQVSTAAQLVAELKLAMDIMKAKAEVDAKTAAAAAAATAGSSTTAK
jgi:anaphase-promoting complex subunit 8